MEWRGMDATGSVKRQMTGSCEDGHRTSGSKKSGGGGEFIHWLMNRLVSEIHCASSGLVKWSVGWLVYC
jgi:hypothetical protein